MVHGTIASTQVSTHSSHPLRYPFTYLRKLRDWGGGWGGLHALRGWVWYLPQVDKSHAVCCQVGYVVVRVRLNGKVHKLWGSVGWKRKSMPHLCANFRIC